jgi:hypothetical protein
LYDAGVYIPAVGFPTVPEGKARLRAMVTATHKRADLERGDFSGNHFGLKLSSDTNTTRPLGGISHETNTFIAGDRNHGCMYGGRANGGLGTIGGAGVGSLMGGVASTANATAGAATGTVMNTASSTSLNAGETANGATRSPGAVGGLTSTGRLMANSSGVFGLQGLSLDSAASSAAQGSTIVSATKNVHLDSGTQLVLRASGQAQ